MTVRTHSSVRLERSAHNSMDIFDSQLSWWVHGVRNRVVAGSNPAVSSGACLHIAGYGSCTLQHRYWPKPEARIGYTASKDAVTISHSRAGLTQCPLWASIGFHQREEPNKGYPLIRSISSRGRTLPLRGRGSRFDSLMEHYATRQIWS